MSDLVQSKYGFRLPNEPTVFLGMPVLIVLPQNSSILGIELFSQ